MEPRDDLLLGGVRVLVTRASHQSTELSDALRHYGAEVIEVPLLQIAPPESWDAVDEAIKSIDEYNWIVFASSNAVRMFFQRLHESDKRLADTISIAAIGPATAHAVSSDGYSVKYQPSKFIAESFVKEFPGMPDMSGQRILWVRGNVGRDLIETVLKGAGATVTAVTAYRNQLPENADAVSQELFSLFSERKIDIVTFASGQTVKNLSKLLQQRMSVSQQSELVRPIGAATIGPETTKAAGAAGFQRIWEAGEFNTKGLLAAVVAAAHN